MARIRSAITLFLCFALSVGIVSASELVVNVPCSFPFDASKSDVVLEKQFVVRVYRNYQFTLNFLHHGGDEAKRLYDLLNPKYLIITRESANDEKPVVVTLDYLAQHGGGTLSERGLRRDVGVQTGEFIQKVTNFAGERPVEIQLFRVDENGNERAVQVGVYETLQHFSGGNGQFSRNIAGAALKTGRYRILVRTLKDSPQFSDNKIEFGITYYAKAAPLKE